MSPGKAVQASFVCSMVFIVVVSVSYFNCIRINIKYTIKQGTTIRYGMQDLRHYYS